MLKVFILLGIIVACYSEMIHINPRVDGGSPVEIDNFPYAVSVQFIFRKGSTHFSTGTILSNRWILTTASRLKYISDPSKIQVRTGSTHSDYTVGADYIVEEKIQHPSYDPYLFEFDLALLKVDQDIVFNEKTQPIGLFTEDSVDANLSGSLVGWGNTYDNSLKVSRLYSIELKTVGTIDGRNLYVNVIGDGVCYWDVGGAFVVDGKVLGISTGNRLGCGLTDQYVNRFDSNTLEWINSVVV